MTKAGSVVSAREEKPLSPRNLQTTTVVGWLLFALVNMIAQAVTRGRSSRTSLTDEFVFHFYDVGAALLFGLVIALCMRLWVRGNAARPVVGWAIAALASSALGLLTLTEDLAGPASRLSGGSASRLPVLAMAAVVALGVPFVAFVAQWFARKFWRLIPLVGGVVVAAANHMILRNDYLGAHLLLGASAACAIAGALRGVRVPFSNRVLSSGLVAVIVVALGSALLPPPNRVAGSLRTTWAAGMSRLLPRTWLRHHAVRTAPRAAPSNTGVRQDVPPSGLLTLPPDPVVVYYSVDSLRADLLTRRYARQFPELHRLRDESVWFTQARAPGSQTAYTLTSVMTGTYFSQQYWTKKRVAEGKGFRALMPHEDPTVRFPTILANHGVPTVQYAQAVWLLNEYGQAMGFTEERFIEPVPGQPSTKGKWSSGDDVMRVIEARLRRHGAGPLFLFFHDLDPHAPFDLGRLKKGSARARYLSEVELVDRRIGRLREVLDETGLAERTVLIFTADHGEGFGEHGTSFHGQNLYDEQVRVPLLVHVPGLPPRKVDRPVTLVDLGPTILDVMDLTTPSYFLGQTLVPFLLGQSPAPSRPIVAEGRLKQMMLLPSGLKVIRNQREKTFEIYDLSRDPGERRNLYDAMGPKGLQEMQTLIDFFETYKIRKKGYEIPYRR